MVESLDIIVIGYIDARNLRTCLTRRICREVLSLPMSAETSDAHVDSVVDALRRFFGTR